MKYIYRSFQDPLPYHAAVLSGSYAVSQWRRTFVLEQQRRYCQGACSGGPNAPGKFYSLGRALINACIAILLMA
jgi:hypothetical protein